MQYMTNCAPALAQMRAIPGVKNSNTIEPRTVLSGRQRLLTVFIS